MLPVKKVKYFDGIFFVVLIVDSSVFLNDIKHSFVQQLLVLRKKLNEMILKLN